MVEERRPRRVLRRLRRKFRVPFGSGPAADPGPGDPPARRGREEGGAGVREPRRPVPQAPSGAAALPVPEA